MVEEKRVEETLDPEDWDELKVLGHKMVDDMIDHLATVRQRPPVILVNEQTAAAFMKPIPMEPEGIDKAYVDFKKEVLDTHGGLNTHPRFWGWVVGTGTAQGALAEMLATGINFNMPGGPFAPVLDGDAGPRVVQGDLRLPQGGEWAPRGGWVGGEPPGFGRCT